MVDLDHCHLSLRALPSSSLSAAVMIVPGCGASAVTITADRRSPSTVVLVFKLTFPASSALVTVIVTSSVVGRKSASVAITVTMYILFVSESAGLS